jgi:O-antigen ligase
MLLANLAMPHRFRLIGVAILVVPQLHLPVLPVSVAVVWTLMTCIAGLTMSGRSRPSSPLLVVLELLTAITALSLLWAVPAGIHLGVVTVCVGLLFLLWLREVMVLASDEPGLLDTMMMWAVPGIAVQSVLVMLFRGSPALEERFLSSGLGAATVGPAAANIYTDTPPNVVDPGRAGGFFVNGNVASLFGCVAAVLLCVVARRRMQRWLYAVAALSAAGAVCTGSKSVFIIGMGLVFVIVVLPRIRKVPALLVTVAAVLVTPLVFSMAIDVVERIAPSFHAAADMSYDTRAQLWARAAQMFEESPVLGTGFGGWAERVGRVGSRTDLPPHNFIVATWAYSGILAAVLSICFMVVTVAFGLRVVASQPTIRDRRTAVFALCAVAWAFLHGMGDNTAVYGDRQSMILVAIAFGYLFAMQQTPPAVTTDEIPYTSDCSESAVAVRLCRRGQWRSRWRPDPASRRLGRAAPRRASRDRIRVAAPARRRPTPRIPERLDICSTHTARSQSKATAVR